MPNSIYINGWSLTLTATLASALCTGLAISGAEADVPELPIWDHSWETRLAAGYNDNVLLSSARPERSPLIFGGLEYSASRLPVDGNQFFLLISGEATRYLDSAQVDDEMLFSSIAQFKRFSGENWEWGITGLHIYQDEVIDSSVTEANRGILNYRGHGFVLKPSVKRSFSGNFWVEVEGLADRHFLAQPFDNYWAYGGQLKLGWDYGHRSELSAAYGYEQRAYDNRVTVDSSGFALPGEALRFDENQVTLEWRHNWDSERRWRMATRLTFASRQDNGSGFFDHARYQISESLRYVAKTWECRAQVKLTQYDFAVQTSAPTNPANRAKTFVLIELRGQYRFTDSLSLFATYEHDRADGNVAGDEYEANTITTGVVWTF